MLVPGIFVFELAYQDSYGFMKELVQNTSVGAGKLPNVSDSVRAILRRLKYHERT